MTHPDPSPMASNSRWLQLVMTQLGRLWITFAQHSGAPQFSLRAKYPATFGSPFPAGFDGRNFYFSPTQRGPPANLTSASADRIGVAVTGDLLPGQRHNRSGRTDPIIDRVPRNPTAHFIGFFSGRLFWYLRSGCCERSLSTIKLCQLQPLQLGLGHINHLCINS